MQQEEESKKKTKIHPAFDERLAFENKFKGEGALFIAGVDEAGRGPLAGPVSAACVIFDVNRPFPDADDSKKLSPAKRDRLYEEIISSCVGFGVGLSDNNVIDEINILNATYRAMQKAIDEAVKMAGVSPDILLVDHVHIPDIPSNIRQCSITHGDALSVSIGAASIIAKVTRDRLMDEYAKEYPGYGFEKHKGYGTKAHYDAIKELGITKIHRKSFLKGIANSNNEQ